MKFVFIYTLRDPRNDMIRYVGKTNNLKVRFGHHMQCRDKRHLRNWILQLKKLGLKPIMEVIDEVPECGWEFWECHYISLFRYWGFNLTNQTSGGNGIINYSHTDISKKKISDRSKEMWKDENYIRKMKERAKGLNNPFSDKKIYSFYHNSFGEVHCTQCELREKYNLSSSHLTQVIKEKRLSTAGWKLLKNKNLIIGFNNDIYVWNHEIYGKRICKKIELMKEFNELTQDCLCRLMNGDRKMHKGWTIEKLAA